MTQTVSTATLLALCLTNQAFSADVSQQAFGYQSTISSDVNGALDLKAELNYNDALTNAPIAVMMHTFLSNPASNTLSQIRPQAQRLRDQGFFVVSVAMRGRNASDGTRDTGGLEIHDIYDAVEAVKANYAGTGLIDTTNVHITGYSGGGGNVMSAVTKFPDYFRAASSLFGISDYGYDATNGWYNNGAYDLPQSTLDNDIGNPNTGGDAVLDKYHARASNLASKNNPYTEIHLFVNSNEGISPVINNTSFRDNAIAAQSFSGEFDNITVHIGGSGPAYEDFNNSGDQQPDEVQSWPHVLPNADQQAAAEQWYTSRLLDGSIAAPTLNDTDELFVAGYVVTKPFAIYLGNGEDTAGGLNYSLSDTLKSFELEILSTDLAKTGDLTIDTADMLGHDIEVRLDGALQTTITGGDAYVYSGLGNGETLTLSAVPEPSSLALLSLGGLCVLRRRRRG